MESPHESISIEEINLLKSHALELEQQVKGLTDIILKVRADLNPMDALFTELGTALSAASSIPVSNTHSYYKTRKNPLAAHQPETQAVCPCPGGVDCCHSCKLWRTSAVLPCPDHNPRCTTPGCGGSSTLTSEETGNVN